MIVSPAMSPPSGGRLHRFFQPGRAPSIGSAVSPQDLCPYHRLFEVELAVVILDGVRLGGQLYYDVDAFGLLFDLLSDSPLTPDVQLVDLAAGTAHDVQQSLNGRGNGALIQARVEDDHHFVLTHGTSSPPVG